MFEGLVFFDIFAMSKKPLPECRFSPLHGPLSKDGILSEVLEQSAGNWLDQNHESTERACVNPAIEQLADDPT